MMGFNGTEFKGVNVFVIRDPDTNLPIFASNKQKYNIDKPMKSLESNIVHAAEVVSPIDHKLEIESLNMHVRGVEGTIINGREIFMSADQNIVLNSTKGSIVFDAPGGIYINNIPKALDVDKEAQARNDLRYKLCLCYPKGVLYRVQLSKLHNVEDPCHHFDRKHYNPCL